VFPSQELLNRLLDQGVDFVIIGGVAAVLHGSAYVTRDLDLCYSRTPDSLGRLVAALEPFEPRLRGAPSDLPFKWDVRTLRAGLNFTLDTDIGAIDLLGEVAGIGGYPEALAGSEPIELFGRRCRVLTLEALIRSKRAAGRQRDLEHVMALEALQELRSKRTEKEPPQEASR
jgi:predicted nucleotidyltransferase